MRYIADGTSPEAFLEVVNGEAPECWLFVSNLTVWARLSDATYLGGG